VEINKFYFYFNLMLFFTIIYIEVVNRLDLVPEGWDRDVIIKTNFFILEYRRP